MCEQKIDPCASGPCHNNASCSPQGAGLGFSCTCPAGFTGPTCAQLVDFCALNPCAHGICRSIGTSYRCLCVPGEDLAGLRSYSSCVCPLHSLQLCLVAMATASCVLRAQTSLSVKYDCTSCAAGSVYPLISPRSDKRCPMGPKCSPVGLRVMLKGMALWRWHFWRQIPVPRGVLRFAHSVKQMIKWFNGSILGLGY